MSADSPAPRLLEARQISKAFPGVQALADVDLHCSAGELLCVVGENGAGKSTLMKILGGVYQQDAGQVLLDGREVQIGSVAQAQKLGITLIHQELNLAESLDVAGNLYLGQEPRWAGPLGLIDRRIYADARRVMDRLGLDCPPRTLVSDLPVGRQQLVEIGRALCMRSRILIMDEPTSSLTERETQRLIEVMRDLKRDGVAILYISHRLKEVQQIADRVTVLRDGRNAGDLAREEITHDALVRLMVGRELKQFFQHSQHAAEGSEKPPALSVREFRRAEGDEPISFDVQAGEVVGLAGLMGAGRTELAEALFGIRPHVRGEVRVEGRAVDLRSPVRAMRAGMALVPEDRRQHGLLLEDTVRHNISLSSLEQLNILRLVTLRRERELADVMCGKLNVRTPSTAQTTGLLSGGNQQKVVLAKWLSRRPRVLILDEPTRGIDVGAKAEIYGLIDELARDGVGILMISSELEEVLGVSDRVLVMHEGRLAGELDREQMSEEAIMHLATGSGEKR